MKNALIIFVRNPVLGKVKTRLAAGIGDEKALLVYEHLLNHTFSIAAGLAVSKFVYYADFVNTDDLWNGFEKKLQQGADLGERMMNAFREIFNQGYINVCIIGSDCHELSANLVESAFNELENSDTVIGPVNDGGYYLLGLHKPIPEFFSNKMWSTSTVLEDTLKDVVNLGLNLRQLPMLHDIDNEQDLQQSDLAFLVDL